MVIGKTLSAQLRKIQSVQYRLRLTNLIINIEYMSNQLSILETNVKLDRLVKRFARYFDTTVKDPVLLNKRIKWLVTYAEIVLDRQAELLTNSIKKIAIHSTDTPVTSPIICEFINQLITYRLTLQHKLRDDKVIIDKLTTMCVWANHLDIYETMSKCYPLIDILNNAITDLTLLNTTSSISDDIYTDRVIFLIISQITYHLRRMVILENIAII